MPHFKKKTKTWCPRIVLEETGKAHCGKKKKKKIYCKTNQAVLPKTVVSSWRQIFSQILKASSWDLQSFVLRCLWIYFPNTVEFFAFLRTVDPSADTNCCLSYPHWPKSVRIIVFLCKQRIEVNNRSAFILSWPASPLFPFFFRLFDYTTLKSCLWQEISGPGHSVSTPTALYSHRKAIDQDMTGAVCVCVPTVFCTGTHSDETLLEVPVSVLIKTQSSNRGLRKELSWMNKQSGKDVMEVYLFGWGGCYLLELDICSWW